MAGVERESRASNHWRQCIESQGSDTGGGSGGSSSGSSGSSEQADRPIFTTAQVLIWFLVPKRYPGTRCLAGSIVVRMKEHVR